MIPDDRVIEIWFHYEEVAMHFNDLLMQYRLQLMGGIGALGTVASYLIGGKVADHRRREWLRFQVVLGMTVLVTAAAALDVFYYKELLGGAVEALTTLEAQHPHLQLSTTIKRRVGLGDDAIFFVYGSLLALLISATIWSWLEYHKHRKLSPDQSSLSQAPAP